MPVGQEREWSRRQRMPIAGTSARPSSSARMWSCAEAYAFLRAINTGHPGSMATVHADSCDGAVEQIALLILQGESRLGRQDVLDYVRGSIGMFVQLGRTGGRRHVTELVCA